MDTVQVPLRRQVFERLQKLAIPLVDDPSSVVERLLEYWHQNPQPVITGRPTKQVEIIVPPPITPNNSVQSVGSQWWQSARGESFPVGAKLRAEYLGKTYEALVTRLGIQFNGRVYDSPSAAGIAVKQATGADGDSAQTNGWEFWEILDPKSGRWLSINILRKRTTG